MSSVACTCMVFQAASTWTSRLIRTLAGIVCIGHMIFLTTVLSGEEFDRGSLLHALEFAKVGF